MKPSPSETWTSRWTGWFVAGLILRQSMLSYMGVFDMTSYIDWGKTALQSGLTKSYHGIYFPLQYQIFELCFRITAWLRSDPVFIFKSSNLLFDMLAFLFLLLLLKRQGASPAYGFLYWFHPWFLAVFSLGYIDFQFTALVLFSVWCLRGERLRDYLLAGIPLGLAFVMKPQAMILVVATFFYAAFRLARKRDIRPLAMLAGPVVFFSGYEIYFTASLFSQLGHKAAYVLPSTYINITNVFPALTAQMTNIWYPIAYLMKQPGTPIYSVSDQIQLLPHVSAKFAAALIVLSLLAISAFRAERNVESTVDEKFIQIFGVASFAVPFIMTSAHENHLFLGTVFLILFLGKDNPLSFKVAAHLVLAIQFLNLYGLYGEHPLWLARLMRSTYSETLAVVYSLVSVACFILILREHFKVSSPRKSTGYPSFPR